MSHTLIEPPETPEPDDAVSKDYEAHIYDGNRCIFCNVNDLDESIYGPFECVKREQYVYTTETGDPPVVWDKGPFEHLFQTPLA